MGPLIGQTNEGLKSQLTSGEVSQDPDSKRILYSIPTLQGSSGSPVMNQYGELVSVNFAKVSGEQSFCFGIPVIHLTELYNSTSVENEPEPFTSATVSENKGNYSTQSPNVTSGISDADYSHKIRSFIKAEEERDFDRIYQHFSPNFRRYWDITNPDYSSLKKRYEYIWSISSNGTNNIESIRKVTNSVYELHTNYSYYSSKKGRTINTYSEVRFVFDENGKIVETYDLN